MNFKGMSLTTKIVSLCMLLTVLGAGVVGFGLYSTSQISEKYAHVGEINLPNAEALGNMLSYQKDVFLHVEIWLQKGKPHEEVEVINKLITEYEKIDTWYQGIPFVDGEAPKYDAVSAAWKDFKAGVLATLDGKELDLIPLHEKFAAALDNLVDFQSEQAKIWSGYAKDTAAKSLWWQSISLGCLLITAFVLSVAIGRGISGRVQTVVEHLSDSANQVTSASAQIASSSEELSQATTEQAASIEQTAASLEEISAMIAKASDSANTSASSSIEAQQKAESGKQSVDQMLTSMNEISQSNEEIMHQINVSNENMAEIVKVIKEIGEKTKVINDIVFQTKLLSFNASVEAARAGEHGKGFAVVAEEVGNLAQMSGNAAKEISEMLEGSISKVEGIVEDTKVKVGALVEQGKAKVESGVGVAKQCAEYLNEIVTNVSTVSALAKEIANASREQAQGVGEINKAMSQLDTVTQQNAAASEEAASAAEELSAQADVLKSAVQELVLTVQGEKGKTAYQAPAKAVAPKAKVVPFKPKQKPEAKVVGTSKNAVPHEDHEGFAEAQ